MMHDFRKGDTVEFISGGWRWPKAGQRGLVTEIAPDDRIVNVDFDGRTQNCRDGAVVPVVNGIALRL